MKIINAQVFSQDFKFHSYNIEIAEDKFAPSQDDFVLDAHNLMAIPGLIDIHLHGAAGFDFMQATDQALRQIACYEAQHGITSICPTTMTMSEQQIFKACHNIHSFKADDKCARILGINMEGPFISPNKVGAQNPGYVLAPNLDFFNKAQSVSGGLIKLLALAPEREQALELIKALQGQVVCSIAHTDANYDQCKAAIQAGVTHLTHLFNAMPCLHHRAPGPILAGADDKGCQAEIICDGIHVHEAAVRAAFKIYGADRMILISDSMMATGLDDGHYQLGGQEVIVNGPEARLNDGTLAGSVTNLFDCLKICVTKMQIPIADAIRAATYNPAQCLGLHEKLGMIGHDHYADLLLIDNSFNLKAVLLRGKWLFEDL